MYTICNKLKRNRLNKNNKINKSVKPKLIKTFRGTFRNPTTFGDAYNIPPVYM